MIKFKKEQFFIVTGASSGIGKGVTQTLNMLGASVIGIARNEKRLNEMRSECKYPENCHIEIKDLTDDIENLPQYIKSLKEKYGKFSGIVCCAGTSEIVPLRCVDLHKMQEIFSIDYFVPIFMLKGFSDKRNHVQNASCVIISSCASLLSDKGHVIYSGAKAALNASMKVIAKEVAQNKLRVNCILPSTIDTPLSTETENIVCRNKQYPLGIGHVDDVANMVTFLLSDKSQWITGQNYVLDCASF